MRVELLCLDVDGTLTDGSLIYGFTNSASCGDFSHLRKARFLDEPSVLSSSLASHKRENSSTILEFASCVESVKSAESTLDSAFPKQGANSSIFDEKSGLCSHERGNRTNEFIDEASGELSDLSHPTGCEALAEAKKDAEFAEILKVFNAKDGLALAYWCKSLNRKVAIITGKKSEVLRHRSKELGIELLFMGVSDKGKIVRDLKKDLGLDSAQVACVGDDLNDISMFRECALKFAPHDCASHLKTLPNIEILRCKGGRGAVREAIESILQKEGIYEDFINFFTH